LADFTRRIEAAIPIVMPALGGLAGVIWVNMNKMDFINPVLGIGGGIVGGWIAGRILLKLMQRRR
jgi:uncharacterized membrane protein